MNKIIIMLSVVLLMTGMSACKLNRKTESVVSTSFSADWLGKYTGILPCADCEGIQTQITLLADTTYKLDWQYIDKENASFSETGTFQWNEADSLIILNNMEDGPSCYKVGKNTLTQLDLEGEIITGELAENYVLVKSE
ncbi:MAG: copper resistance protein NlpE [Dysgonamonadaceae bacterium]|jgi:uncharacterized lipoprotein NlpE involved in copper resistance|nr:copper resistance protein NlpE [Dysgonamonadaceae bacterium]